MLEDIAPVARSAKKVKIVSAGHDSIDQFPSVDSRISFRPFINYLKDKLTERPDTRSRIYNYLIERLESEPALLQTEVNSNVLEENGDLLELLGTTLFHVVSEQEKNLFTMAMP